MNNSWLYCFNNHLELETCVSEIRVPSLKGFVRQYNQELCSSSITSRFTKRLQLRPLKCTRCYPRALQRSVRGVVGNKYHLSKGWREIWKSKFTTLLQNWSTLRLVQTVTLWEVFMFGICSCPLWFSYELRNHTFTTHSRLDELELI